MARVYGIIRKPKFLGNSGDVAGITYRIAKKLTDKVLALLLLALLSPVFFGIAAVILLTDGGPVFFAPILIGKHGVPFRKFKFRTLSKHHRPRDAQFNVIDHECPNRFMAFMRNHKLDELPQLLNVLIGNMSLIGPRPITAAEAEVVQQDPFMAPLLVHALRADPGISGLWQVTCSKLVGWKKRMRRDAIYAESCGISLDVRIALLTLAVIAKGEDKIARDEVRAVTAVPKPEEVRKAA